jgi:hypothetical protein
MQTSRLFEKALLVMILTLCDGWGSPINGQEITVFAGGGTNEGEGFVR